MRKQKYFPEREKGVALIIVILVLTFLLSIGVTLVTVTGTGPRVSGNMRLYQQAFNAAEAGFDAAWIAIEGNFSAGGWTSFDGHYLKTPTGIDIPSSTNYFRKLTDKELIQLLDQNNDGMADSDNVIFFNEKYIPATGGGLDARYMYTAFLIDDEAGGALPDPSDALLVCVGIVKMGTNITTSRLEIGLATQLPGTNP